MKRDNNSIQIFFISIIFVVVSLTGMGIYQYVNIKNAEEQIYSTLRDSINEQKILMDTKIQGQYTILETFANNIVSVEMHKMDEVIPRMDSIVKTKSTEFKYLAIGGKDGILYTNDGRTVDVANRDYYKQALKGEHGIEKIDTSRLDCESRLIISIPLLKNDEVLGVVIGSYDISTFDHLLNPMTFKDQGYSYLINTDGNIILNSNSKNSLLNGNSLLEILKNSNLSSKKLDRLKNDLHESKKGVLHYSVNRHERYAVYQSFEIKDWILVHIVPADVLKSQTHTIIFSGWLIISILSIMAILTVSLILHNEIKYIKQMEKHKVALMVSQIKPHFLYNTLTAIQDMCYCEPRQAAKAIVKFSKYLRTNIDFINSEELIPFSLEKEHIDNYISIEMMRFGEDLHFETDIQVDDFLLPPLTIQPLIENAVKHGICKRVEKGTVKLSTERVNSNIVITIKDNGIGFDKKTVTCRALESVETRILKIMHGKMIVHSNLNIGTTITITIPFKEALHEDSND